MAFGRLEKPEGSRPMSDINMTPLIDVMMVLLVIFMIAAPLMTASLRLDLPKSEAATPSDAPSFIAVTVTPDGRLHLGDDELDAKAFQQRINELGRANAQMEVQLRADRAVPYGQVAELIGWVQAAGLNRIAFVAQAAASAP
ncbi:biopolymer transporter ExbD [Roseateles saccharophilus]|uniref:Biopolymer transport protein ExbD/biopolymer transport protein TolR n=2 Tax=Roseateles saccharophilus TaxID=304 RepID=A0A4R3VK17_ROSSA|nr:biopolymer transporter ExbD [Roseateles saccharophilus]MDG0832862.1 biopolymer transporter ExbD [Roseateles saccharophilus]TCV04533.1 biopolymer transport protein ExbD/biopolymer transport protein TolR [Roseateles saccharophilus]